MAVNNLRQRLVAFVAGLILGPAVVWAGLETGTYISDLVATNPLGSDLASTLDDHIRLLKSTIKATFPNVNGAVTVTDETLNAVPTGSANPTGTIGLSAVNGSATTYMRSDAAPVLSQAIVPTWSAQHIFSKAGGVPANSAIYLSSTAPEIVIRQSDAAADNRIWDNLAFGEQLIFRSVNDAENATGNWMTVDRTGTTIDRVAHPTDTANAFVSGTAGSNSAATSQFRSTARSGLLAATSAGAAQDAMRVHNEATSGDNVFVAFLTEAGGGTSRGTIDYDRAGGATRYKTTSDARLKKNFRPAPSARGVIDCINIESYDWRETGFHVDHGVVAQRLIKCAPYAVSKGNVWQVDKITLIPALIKYVQEQDARISRLEADAARRH